MAGRVVGGSDRVRWHVGRACRVGAGRAQDAAARTAGGVRDVLGHDALHVRVLDWVDFQQVFRLDDVADDHRFCVEHDAAEVVARLSSSVRLSGY
jgi:hypothetical protein